MPLSQTRAGGDRLSPPPHLFASGPFKVTLPEPRHSPSLALVSLNVRLSYTLGPSDPMATVK
jgi:hypothetical protein